MAFNAKNLTYDSNEPAFLRRLRSEHGEDGSIQNNRPLARPKKQRSDDEDDEPIYVVEESHETVTRAEYNILLEHDQSTPQEDNRKQTIIGPKKDQTDDSPRQEHYISKQQLASIGGLNRKRAAKTLGADTNQRSAKQPKGVSGDERDQRRKKSSKKPKLSFEE